MTLFDAYRDYSEHLKSENNKPVGFRRSSWSEELCPIRPGVFDDQVLFKIKPESPLSQLSVEDMCATDWEVVYS